MKTKFKVLLICIVILCVLALRAKFRYEGRISLELSQRNQLIIMCEDAGYSITKDNVTLEREKPNSYFMTWRWHVTFDDEPDIQYVFQQPKDGGWCCVEIIGDDAPQKTFYAAEHYRGDRW